MNRKHSTIKPEEFFRQVALRAGIAELKTVKNIYYGMLKVLTSGIRGSHSIVAPDWGEFRLTVYKPRRALNVGTMKVEMLPTKPTVKFTPDYKLKKYFQSLVVEEERTIV